MSELKPCPRPEGAISALADYEQADMDGVMVIVSRQAIEEVLEYLNTRPEASDELAKAGTDYYAGLYAERCGDLLKAKADAERLAEAVLEAAEQFDHYEQLHRAKGTPEGHEKANVNAIFAARLRGVVASYREKNDG